MTFLQSFLLGIIEGLTEFVPVSSTAHLLIAQTLFGIPADGAMFSFLVIVQLGTLISLFAFYWKDLISIARALVDFRHASSERDLGIYIIVATIPALLAGYLLKNIIENLFKDPLLEASVRLLSAAVLLALAEWLTKKSRKLDSMTWLDALIVGLFQIVAVFPGASRSGATISGGMFRGFDRPAAARFAFLISVPVILAAGGYQMLDVLKLPNLSQFLPLLAVGFVTAAIVGWFAIRWLLAFLQRHSLYAFAGYCAIIGLVCFGISLF
jgi:undecaprenyl-diphosphatase